MHVAAVADKVEAVQVFLSPLQYSPANYPFAEPKFISHQGLVQHVHQRPQSKATKFPSHSHNCQELSNQVGRLRAAGNDEYIPCNNEHTYVQTLSSKRQMFSISSSTPYSAAYVQLTCAAPQGLAVTVSVGSVEPKFPSYPISRGTAVPPWLLRS
jgi:hypothetical protein